MESILILMLVLQPFKIPCGLEQDSYYFITRKRAKSVVGGN